MTNKLWLQLRSDRITSHGWERTLVHLFPLGDEGRDWKCVCTYDVANVSQSNRALALLKGFENLSNLLMSCHHCHRGDKSQWQSGRTITKLPVKSFIFLTPQGFTKHTQFTWSYRQRCRCIKIPHLVTCLRRYVNMTMRLKHLWHVFVLFRASPMRRWHFLDFSVTFPVNHNLLPVCHI